MDSKILIFLVVILILALAFWIYVNFANRQRSGLDRAYYQKQWQKIDSFKKNGSAGCQLAIIEADKLLDHALKQSGFYGATMGDRLKDANRSFMNVNDVWQAHKLRNRLAHEQNVNLNFVATDKALRSFRSALKDLGAL